MITINPNNRLEKQLNFIIEVDKVKGILRKTKLFHEDRFENDAEHSWSVCMMALLLKEYSNFSVDIEKVIEMLLIHDIIEIDAGDTFLYAANREDAKNSEKEAAQRIFGLLEKDQKEYFINLWEEFEAKETNEAKFASAFDRLEPLMQNFISEGYTWKKHNITYDMVIKNNQHIKNGASEIWEFVLNLLEIAVEKGYLTK